MWLLKVSTAYHTRSMSEDQKIDSSAAYHCIDRIPRRVLRAFGVAVGCVAYSVRCRSTRIIAPILTVKAQVSFAARNGEKHYLLWSGRGCTWESASRIRLA